MANSDDRKERQLGYILSRLDEHIRIELDLVGQRMNVLAVSQAFLFTAFTTAMLVSDQSRSLKALQTVLLRMIPLLGTAICVIVGVALCAAVSVVRSRKRERTAIRDLLREEFAGAGLTPGESHREKVEMLEQVELGSWPHRLGNYPPLFLAPVIAACWLLLFGYVMTV